MKSIAALGGCLVGAAAFFDCHLSHECSLVGCDYSAIITADLPIASNALAGARFTFCLNDECASGISLPDAGYDGYPPDSVELSPVLFATVQLSYPDAGDVHVELDFGGVLLESDGGVEIIQPHDGDVYRVSIVAADGSSILNATRTASYTTYYPNGPDCDPTCREATIDVTQ